MEEFHKLRKIFVIRHGLYNNKTDRLNADGEEQMRSLLEPLKKHLAGEEHVVLLSSSAERAEDSVKIISDGLGIAYKVHPYFWSDNDHMQLNNRALDLINQITTEMNADVVILLTHLEYAKELPSLLCYKCGNKFIGEISLDKGGMIFLDMEKQIHTLYND